MQDKNKLILKIFLIVFLFVANVFGNENEKVMLCGNNYLLSFKENSIDVFDLNTNDDFCFDISSLKITKKYIDMKFPFALMVAIYKKNTYHLILDLESRKKYIIQICFETNDIKISSGKRLIYFTNRNNIVVIKSENFLNYIKTNMNKKYEFARIKGHEFGLIVDALCLGDKYLFYWTGATDLYYYGVLDLQTKQNYFFPFNTDSHEKNLANRFKFLKNDELIKVFKKLIKENKLVKISFNFQKDVRNYLKMNKN